MTPIRRKVILFVGSKNFYYPVPALPVPQKIYIRPGAAIIHSYAPEWGSSMSRQSEVKKINYIWGKAVRKLRKVMLIAHRRKKMKTLFYT